MGEPAVKKVTYAEYLDQERGSDVKHEYFNGQIFAMAGGTPAHSLVATNVAGELRNRLRARPCAVFTSDLRVRVRATGFATYPDVTVICGQPEWHDEDKDSPCNPTVLVEVLSPSTEAYDRGEKFAHYREIPSLRDYVLVSSTTVRVEHFHRNDDGTFTYRALGEGERLVLPAISCDIPLSDIYDKLDLVRGPATP